MGGAFFTQLKQSGGDGDVVVNYTEGFRTRMIERLAGPERGERTVRSPRKSACRRTRCRDGCEKHLRCRPWGATRTSGVVVPQGPRKWSGVEKLQVVLEAASIPDAELGEFLRKKGIHEADLKAWREVVRKSAADALEGGGKAAKHVRRGRASDQGPRAGPREEGQAAEGRERLARAPKKSPRDLGGRGRAHEAEERVMILRLLAKALEDGAEQGEACEILGVNETTVQRWRKQPGGEDRRAGPIQAPKNKLKPAEYRGSPGNRHIAGVPRSRPEPDRSEARGSRDLRRVRVHDLPDPPQGEDAASSRAFASADEAASSPRATGDGAEPGVELGHHVPEVADQGRVLLPLRRHRRVEPQDRRLDDRGRRESRALLALPRGSV